MIENLIVFVIVAGAALWLLRRWLPSGLRARLGAGPKANCSQAGACGTKGCDRCH